MRKIGAASHGLLQLVKISLSFELGPDNWSPQYGGRCTYPICYGDIFPTVSEESTIYEDRLYMNFPVCAHDLRSYDILGDSALKAANFYMLKDKKRGPLALYRVSTFKLIIIPLDQFFTCGLNIVRGERTRPVSCLATARCGSACVTFHTGAIAHQCVVPAIAAGLAFVTLHFGLCAFVHCGHRGRNRF